MSLRNIVTWPDPVLSQVALPVPEITEEIRTLAADLLETMYAAPGRGLAAPQVGVLYRLFVMDATWKDGEPDPLVWINPEIVEYGPEVSIGEEGCLSIPGVAAQVERPASAHFVWTNLEGVVQDCWLDGFAARCAQHEMDHLEGVTTLDRVDNAQRTALLTALGAA
ncbi:MAG: peptide deformylase [Pseudomonadota bacterium]